MTKVRKPVRSRRESGTCTGTTLVTATFWRCLEADAKCIVYWSKYAETHYLRSLQDEPMPGIWPKYTARWEIAMAIFQALEEGGKGVPAELCGGAGERGSQDGDTYALAAR